MEKTLIVFYSLEGHTAHIANVLKEKLDCDMIEIKPKKEIKAKGFMKYFWGGKQVKMNEEPELEPIDIDFGKYQTIFVGTPIWAWSATPPIRTFLKGDYIKNKDLYVFYSYDGGNAKAEDRIKNMITGNNLKGIQGILNNKKNPEKVDEDINTWIDSLDLK